MTIVARPYTRAVVEIAKANHTIAFWFFALRYLSMAIQDPVMHLLLNDPRYQSHLLAEILIGVLHDVAHDNDQPVDFKSVENLLRLLAEKKRLSILPAIDVLFHQMIAKETGKMRLSVSSAFAMDANAQQKIKEKLAQQLKCQLSIEFHEDAQLIGGLLIRSDQWVMDGSVSGQLKRLATVLS